VTRAIIIIIIIDPKPPLMTLSLALNEYQSLYTSNILSNTVLAIHRLLAK
jgi:hypothetical protein